ncbi:MAG: sulfate transporter CysZ [Gammaproteobacteria bacterium]
MIGSFASGYRYGLAGLSWLFRRETRLHVLLPMIVNIVVFSLGIAWLVDATGNLQATAEAWLPAWLDWLAWLLWPIAVVGVLVVVWLGFTLMANLLGSPFNGLLSERVQQQYAPGLGVGSLPVWQEAIKAPYFELVKIAYFAVLAIPPLLLSFVPVVNVLAPLVWAVYGSWILAVEYCDYPMSNVGIRLRDQKTILRQDRWRVLGFGAGVMTLTVIPGLNLVAMPSAVIGATLMWCDRLASRAAGP